MEKRKITAISPIMVSGFTIVPIVQTTVYGAYNVSGSSVSGFKKPVYVLVLYPGAPPQMFTISGNEVPPESVILQHPELEDQLKQYY
jgi:hypothetical protein